MIKKLKPNSIFDAILNISYITTILSLFILLFGTPRGHNYIEGTIIASISLGFLKYIFTRQYNKVHLLIIGPSILYGIMLIINTLIHGDHLRLSKAFLYIPLFIIFAPKIKNSEKIIGLSAAFGTSYFFFITIMQYISGISRPDGFTNAILFSQAIFIFFLFNIYFFKHEENYWLKTIYLAASVMSISIILLTQTRGVWITLIILLAIVIVKKSFKKPIKYLFISIFSIFACLSLYSYSPLVNNKTNLAISDLQKIKNNKYNTSWGLRVLAWKSASIGIQENFLIGVGLEGFQKNKQMQVDNGQISPLITKANLYHTHNQYMQNLLIRGLPGIIALITLIASVFFIRSENKKPNQLLYTISISYAIFGISDVPLEYLNTSYLFLTSISLIYLYLIKNNHELTKNQN